jgi:phage terminase small subunit
MPVLKNQRHELFAQALASGKNATDAYELAGYKRSHSNGPALARTEEISARVAQITAEAFEQQRVTTAAAAERAVITRHGLIEMAQEVRNRALQDGQLSAAVAAIKEIGVLSGIRIERSERGQPGDFDWLEKLSVEELRALADGKLDIASYRQNDAGNSRPH